MPMKPPVASPPVDPFLLSGLALLGLPLSFVMFVALALIIGTLPAFVVIYLLPPAVAALPCWPHLMNWYRATRSHRVMVGATLVILTAVIANAAWERRGVKNGYKALEAAVAEGRWSDAYAMMTPDYRARVSLSEFVRSDIQVPEMSGHKSIFAFFGYATVYPSGSAGMFPSGYELKFRRVGWRWCYTGEIEQHLF